MYCRQRPGPALDETALVMSDPAGDEPPGLEDCATELDDFTVANLD